MMINGYASDNSNGSKKRTRFDESSPAPSSSKGNNNSKKDTKYVSPLEIAIVAAGKYTKTLRFNDMRNDCQNIAETYLRKYATAYRAQKQFDKDSNDPSYIANSAKLSFTLQPMKVVSQDQEFKDLVRMTQEIVQECRERLTKQHLACTEMNNKALKAEVTETFVHSLKEIVDYLYAEYDVQGLSPHVAIANILHSNRAAATGFLKIDSEKFNAIYCRVHGLDTIPPPSNPSIPTITDINVTEELQALGLRGGGGTDGSNNSDGLNNNSDGLNNTGTPVQRPPTPRESLQAQSVQLNRQLNPYLRGITTQGTTPTLGNNTQFVTAAEVLVQQQTPPQHDQTSLAIAAAANTAATAAAASTTTPQLLNNNGNNVSSIEDGEIPAVDPTSTADDVDMEDDADNNNNNGEGGIPNNQQQQQQPPPQQNNITHNNTFGTGGGGGGAPPPVGGGARTIRTPDPKMVNIQRDLLTIITEVFIKPLGVYEQQMNFNEF